MNDLEKVLTEIALDLEKVENKINSLRVVRVDNLSMFEGQLLGLDKCLKKVKYIDDFLDTVRYLNHLTKDFTDFDLKQLEKND